MQEANNQNLDPGNSPDDFLEHFKKSLDTSYRPLQQDNGAKSPPITDKQINYLITKLLESVEIIPGFNLPVWKYFRKFQKILTIFENEHCALHKMDPKRFGHTHIHVCGRSAAEVVESDPEYVKDVLSCVKSNPSDLPLKSNAQLPFLDLDFKIKSPLSDEAMNLKAKALLITSLTLKAKRQPNFAHRSIEDVRREIITALDKKFWIPNELDTPDKIGNRFMLLSVGSRAVSVDLVTHKKMRRKFLLSPDGIIVPFNVVRNADKTISLTDQRFQSKNKDYKAERPVIRPSPTRLQLARTLLDRNAKLVHFPVLSTMDGSGWFKLMQYYVQSYRSADREFKLLERIGSVECFAETLDRFCRNHFQNDPTGLYFYLLNCLLCFQRHEKWEDYAVTVYCQKPEWFSEKLSQLRHIRELKQLRRLKKTCESLSNNTKSLKEYSEPLSIELRLYSEWLSKQSIESSQVTQFNEICNQFKQLKELKHFEPLLECCKIISQQLNEHEKFLFKQIKIYCESLLIFQQHEEYFEMLSSIGLLLLSTESNASQSFNVKPTFNAQDHSALMWTHTDNDKRTHSFIMSFNPRTAFDRFAKLFKDSPLYFSTLLKGRRTKEDLSRIVTILKQFKITEADVMKCIADLGSTTDPRVEEIAQLWMPIARQLREIPKFTTKEEMITFLREFLPTVKRIESQNEHRSFLNELMFSCISGNDVVEIARNLATIDQWKTMYPWISDETTYKTLVKQALQQIENLLKDPKQKLSTAALVLSGMKSSLLQREAAPYFQRIVEFYLNVSDKPVVIHKIVKEMRIWDYVHPWIYPENAFKPIFRGCLDRIQSLLVAPQQQFSATSQLLAEMTSTPIQNEFRQNFRAIANHFLAAPENHPALVDCLNAYPWLYQETPAESISFIESLLKEPLTDQKLLLAKSFVLAYFQKGTDLERIRPLLSLVPFKQFPPEAKKIVQSSYASTVQALHDNKHFSEIISLYSWLGITGTMTPGQVKSVLPQSMSAEFQDAFRSFMKQCFRASVMFPVNAAAAYEHMTNIRKWRVECPWVFENAETFVAIENAIVTHIMGLLEKEPTRTLVLLKDFLAKVKIADQNLFAPQFRALLTKAISAKDDQLIWNLISIKACLDAYPWICPETDPAHRVMMNSILSMIGEALNALRPDQRWFDLADRYIRELGKWSDTGQEVAVVLLKPIMRTHKCTPDLVTYLRTSNAGIFKQLSEAGNYKDIIQLDTYLNVMEITTQLSVDVSEILLKAYHEEFLKNSKSDKRSEFKAFLTRAKFSEGESVIFQFTEIVQKLLADNCFADASAICDTLKDYTTVRHACRTAIFSYMTSKIIEKGDLSVCRQLLLEPQWGDQRANNPIAAQRLRDTCFVLSYQSGFSQLSFADAFELIRNVSPTNYSQWEKLCEHIDLAKSKELVSIVWKTFCALSVPEDVVKYGQLWVAVLGRAVAVDVVQITSIPALYQPIRNAIESAVRCNRKIEMSLKLFHIFSRDPVKSMCTPDCKEIVDSILASYPNIPCRDALTHYQLLTYSSNFESFGEACRGISQLLEGPLKENVVLAAIELMKQCKKFNSNAIPADKQKLYEEAFKLILDIYKKLKKNKAISLPLFEEIHNSFVLTENRELIIGVLNYLSPLLMPVLDKDGYVSFHSYQCGLDPDTLMTLFDFILKNEKLDTEYRVMARRILGHPSTYPIIAKLVTVDHWVREMKFRGLDKQIKASRLNDYETDCNDLIFYANAPDGVALHPKIAHPYTLLIASLAASNHPTEASRIQLLLAHCLLGKTFYDKKCPMIGTYLKTSNNLFREKHIFIFNETAPYLTDNNWKIKFIQFQTMLVERLLLNFGAWGTLADAREHGGYLKLFMDTQIALLIGIYPNTRDVPEKATQHAVELIRHFLSSVLLMPQTEQQQRVLLNETYNTLRLMIETFPEYEEVFGKVKRLHTLLAEPYTLKEVPNRFLASLSSEEKSGYIVQLVDAITDPAQETVNIAAACQLVRRSFKNETKINYPIYHKCLKNIIQFLQKGPNGVLGQIWDTYQQLSMLSLDLAEVCIRDIPNLVQGPNYLAARGIISELPIEMMHLGTSAFSDTNRAEFPTALLMVQLFKHTLAFSRQNNLHTSEERFGLFVMISTYVSIEVANCCKARAFDIAENLALEFCELLAIGEGYPFLKGFINKLPDFLQKKEKIKQFRNKLR